MNSKHFFSVAISVLLIVLIVVILIGNKKEIDRKARLSLEVNTVIPVNVTQPQWTEINPSITATGKIVADNSLVITSKTQGTVLAKYRKTGDRVTKGTPVAKVEDQLILEGLRVAESGYAKAKKDAERYESLQKAGAVTKSETEAMQLALKNAEQQVFDLKDRLQNTVLSAPVSGVLENVMVEEGSLVAPGMAVAEIIDPTRLKMEISVTEKEVIRLRRGQTVRITSDVFENKTFEGQIQVVGVQGNDAMSYKVEIAISASDDLKPGMFAVAHIESGAANNEKKLVIDRRCIVGGLKNPKVYTVSGDKASLRSIVVGLVTDSQVEVINGLTENETVVLDGQINLTEGAKISVIKNEFVK
ncbi:MAG: efflux RND transporter periplasmic adaptor subunit [Dysgonamonadaceae bacterium]|jgi:RND family efflux transporter MFP subunit|nr:efflux RND transporter periplasmic adaptor subunit [Dysgonamonadaceae bacterium]